MAAAVNDGLCLRLSAGHAAQEAPSLEGLVVVDVVEGTAVASLPRMSAILSNRPPSFPSLQVALEWARHSGSPSVDCLASKGHCLPPHPSLQVALEWARHSGSPSVDCLACMGCKCMNAVHKPRQAHKHAPTVAV